MDSSRRLDVLTRQLTAGSRESAPTLLDGTALSAICARSLGVVLVHDNSDLRQAVFEFLKVV
jgi:hypothetical protein